MIIVPSSWSTAQPSSTEDLIKKVLRPYGGNTSDDELKSLAKDALDETVKEMNTHLYEFNKVTATDLDIVDGTQDILMPTTFYRESFAYLVDKDNNEEPPLVFIDPVNFQRLYGNSPSNKGWPIAYTIRNIHNDGKLSLGPTPDSTVASTRSGTTLTGGRALYVEYYRRIPLPSENAQLTIPQEVEVPLLYGAQKRLSIDIAGPGNPDWATFQTLEDRSLEKLQAVDRRHPDEATRFRLYDRASAGVRRRVGALYVRIG